MIRRKPEIHGVRITRSGLPWDQLGVIGFASVHVDQVQVGPIFLVRNLEGEIDQFLSHSILNQGLPACVVDLDVRSDIWMAVTEATDELDAGVPEK